MISMDLPGCFPINSARGNVCIFVMYDFDSDIIIAASIKNRTKALIQGYKYFSMTLQYQKSNQYCAAWKWNYLKIRLQR